MKRALLLLALAAGCGGGGGSQPSLPAYVGSWDGAWDTGLESGPMTLEIAVSTIPGETFTLSGTWDSSLGQAVLSGAASIGGNFWMSGRYPSGERFIVAGHYVLSGDRLDGNMVIRKGGVHTPATAVLTR